MRKLLSLVLLCFFVSVHAQIKVVDKSDGKAVSFASIMSPDGCLLGMTDTDGYLPADADTCAFVSVLHMAYETCRIDISQCENKTVELIPQVYDIGNVVVTNSPREYIRMRGYSRTYISDTKDSLRRFQEGMVDYYIPLNKKSNKKNTFTVARTSRNYVIEKLGGKDSIYYNEKPPRKLVDNAMLGVKEGALMVNDKKYSKLNRTAAFDFVGGKHWPEAVYRRNSNITTFQYDWLADKKDHTYSMWGLKLLGITMKMSDAVYVEIYRTNSANQFTLTDLLGKSFSFSMTLGHKSLASQYGGSKLMNIKAVSEVYFTDVCYMTETEAREEAASKLTDVRIEVPAHAPKLSPAMDKLKHEVMEYERHKSKE